MKYKYSFLLLPMIVLQACATTITCGDTDSQVQMTRCAHYNLEALEFELQKKHEVLSETLEARHLEQAIQAWENYRDAHCISTSNVYAGGSLYGYVIAECKAEITRRRLSYLNDDYQDTLDIILQGSP